MQTCLKGLILSIVLAPKFIRITDSELENRPAPRSFKTKKNKKRESILGSGSPGHNISMVTTSKDPAIRTTPWQFSYSGGFLQAAFGASAGLAAEQRRQISGNQTFYSTL